MTEPISMHRDRPGTGPMRPVGDAGRGLWDRVQSEYNIQDSGGKEHLLLAAEALDRLEEISARIAEEGLVVTLSRGDPREHPLLRQETALRAFVSKQLTRLGLDHEPAQHVGRPAKGGLGVSRG
jgi:hypothetical protein